MIDPAQDSGYKSKVMGESDSEYAKHSSRRSVNAGIAYLNGAIVEQPSKINNWSVGSRTRHVDCRLLRLDRLAVDLGKRGTQNMRACC